MTTTAMFTWSREGRSDVERLKTLAKRIETLFPDLVTVLDTWTSSTDRHPSGVRWRIEGKGREGTRLRVFSRRGPGQGPSDYFDPIMEHRAGDTYRRNQDVVEWIDKETAWRERSAIFLKAHPKMNARSWVSMAPEPDHRIGGRR